MVEGFRQTGQSGQPEQVAKLGPSHAAPRAAYTKKQRRQDARRSRMNRLGNAGAHVKGGRDGVTANATVNTTAIDAAGRKSGFGSGGVGSKPGFDSGDLSRPTLPTRPDDPGGPSRPNRMSRKKIILLAALAFVVVLVGGAAGFAAWYMSQLDSAFKMQDDPTPVLIDKKPNAPFYMLVIGSDSREGHLTSDNPDNQGDNQRSDVMMLIRVDAAKRQLTIVSIPRDTALIAPDGSLAKINEAYNIGGSQLAITEASKLTGVPISHYAEVRFSDFGTLIDKLGGIEVDVPSRVSYKDALTGEQVTVNAGRQTLDGQQAQIFVRSRKTYEGNQDEVRQGNIRMLLLALIDKVLSKPINELPGVILDIATCIGTDLEASEIVRLGTLYSGGTGKMVIYSRSGPAGGDIDEASGKWLCYENPEGWKKLMEVVDAGEDPKDLDLESTAIIPSDYSKLPSGVENETEATAGE